MRSSSTTVRPERITGARRRERAPGDGRTLARPAAPCPHTTNADLRPAHALHPNMTHIPRRQPQGGAGRVWRRPRLPRQLDRDHRAEPGQVRRAARLGGKRSCALVLTSPIEQAPLSLPRGRAGLAPTPSTPTLALVPSVPQRQVHKRRHPELQGCQRYGLWPCDVVGQIFAVKWVPLRGQHRRWASPPPALCAGRPAATPPPPHTVK
jgi:hypothetical protein